MWVRETQRISTVNIAAVKNIMGIFIAKLKIYTVVFKHIIKIQLLCPEAKRCLEWLKKNIEIVEWKIPVQPLCHRHSSNAELETNVSCPSNKPIPLSAFPPY